MFNDDSTKEWETVVRPLMNDIILTCRTDMVLVSTLESLINHIDGDILYNRDFSSRLEPTIKVLSMSTHYTGVLKNAYEGEIKKIKDLYDKLLFLKTEVRYDFSSEPLSEEVNIKNRYPNDVASDLKTLYDTKEVKKRIL